MNKNKDKKWLNEQMNKAKKYIMYSLIIIVTCFICMAIFQKYVVFFEIILVISAFGIFYRLAFVSKDMIFLWILNVFSLISFTGLVTNWLSGQEAIIKLETTKMEIVLCTFFLLLGICFILTRFFIYKWKGSSSRLLLIFAIISFLLSIFLSFKI